jgi:2-iminobutanoate/2-iminopropanoate deaminase
LKTRSVESKSAPSTSGGYSQALEVVDAKRLLFVSGQIPESVDGNVPLGFSEQARQVWRNVLAQLDAAQMDTTHIVKVTTFLSSRQYATENSAIRREFLGSHAPALTVIISGIYDEQWLLEIEVTAAA